MIDYSSDGIASLRHEVNNTLTLLSSRLQLLASQYTFLKENPTFIDIQNDLSDIHRLLSYDQTAHHPQLTLCHIEPLLHALYASFLPILHARHIAFYLYIAPQLPAIRADVPLIRQALINLLKNASEATAAGGHITLSAEFDQQDLILSVCDDGKGMTSEQKAHIFEPFVSYKSGGTGLGLPIVQSIILSHHGHLSLETSPGVGSTFRILLPIALSSVEKSSQ